MKSLLRAPIVLLVAALCTVAAVGVPLHGHAAHDGHDRAHVERGHHDHDPGYAQGDARLIQRAPRMALAASVVPTVEVVNAMEPRGEPPAPDEPVGRAPPDPASPRAPPA